MAKIIPGKLALCNNCGITSLDFNRCTRCRRKLPADCKVMDAPTLIANAAVMKQNKDVIIDTELGLGIQRLRTNKVFRNTPITINAVNPDVKKRPRAPARKAKVVPDVPECLTLSSDDEENPNYENDLLENACAELEEGNMEEPDSADEHHCSSGIEGGGLIEQASDGSLLSPHLVLLCRSVRVGSYKVKPLQRVVIAQVGVEIVVPNPHTEGESVVIHIAMSDIKRFYACFDRSMPTVLLLVKTQVGARIREQLKMTDPCSDFYFNPDSKDETHKRITILADKMTDDYKLTLKMIVPKSILLQISYEQANAFLVKSCPKEAQSQLRKASAASKIQTIMVYPPPPAKGGISINTEDYACLGEDVFLNDVIIDFYLKYLTQSVLSPEDRDRIHVFSTFFYKRLTSPPAKSMRTSHPVESDPSLSPAEKRHARVKSWTKNINLFTKDFVIIPINEKCHWFLAIICFPGQDGCLRMCDNSPVEQCPTPTLSTSAATAAAAAAAAAATAAAVAAASGSSKIKVSSNNVLSIGSTTITPVKASDTITLDCSNGEEGSDRDEAEGDEEEMNEPTSEDDEETSTPPDESVNAETSTPVKTESPEKVVPPPTPPPRSRNGRFKSERVAIKQPCILIFDSLMGAPRYRVVATLRDYLRIEHKAKQGREKDFNKDTIKGMMPKVPQQKNFTDCGLYLLQYVEQFFKDPIQDYHYPIKTLKEWFSADVVRRKRQDIQLLLHKLMEEQKIDVSSINLPRLTFNSMKAEEEEKEALARLAEADAEADSVKATTTTSAVISAEAVACASASEAAAQRFAEAAQEAAEAAAAASVHETVYGAAGAEEEVTTDGELPHDDVEGEMEVEDGTVHKMPGPRLVDYDDSPTGIPEEEEEEYPVDFEEALLRLPSAELTTTPLKRTNISVCRGSDTKKMKNSER